MNGMRLVPVLGIHTWMIVMIVIIVVLVAALVALSVYGKKLQDRQAASQKELEEAAQNVTFLVIDKKRMKLKDAGLPQVVLDQAPKYMQGRKVPVVKVKAGAKIMTLMCEEKIFEVIPVKKEVRATVSGIYIMDVKGLRGSLEERTSKTKKKQKFSERVRNKADSMRKEMEQEEKEKKKEKKKNK